MKSVIPIPNLPGSYLITDADTTKAYVGSTTDLRRRANRHERELRNNEHCNKDLQELYNKNNGNLEFVALPLQTKTEALDFEQAVIDAFHNTPVLCNISADARNSMVNFELTMGHKTKLIASNIGRPKSEEQKANISKTLTGRKLSPEHAAKMKFNNLGKKFTEEHKRKISEANKGKVLTEETKQKMRESGKTKIFTPEHRAKLSQALTGRPMKEDNKQKLREINQKPVAIDGDKYSSIASAATALNMTSKMITTRLKSAKYPGWHKL